MHLGIIGFGSIGRALVARIISQVDQITVLRRSGHDQDSPDLRFVTTLPDLLDAQPDLIVECAGHAALHSYAVDILDHGIDLCAASVGALSDTALHDRLTGACDKSGATLILPTGAIGGLDLIATLATQDDVTINYEGIKPPQAWKGSAAETIIDLDGLDAASVFFTGNAQDAAAAYPKNANVVAALAVAAGGFDRVHVKLIADPAAQENTHRYDIISALCCATISIANTATPDNPRTSMTTVASLHKVIMDHAIARRNKAAP